jgi:hypothetical protein
MAALKVSAKSLFRAVMEGKTRFFQATGPRKAAREGGLYIF